MLISTGHDLCTAFDVDKPNKSFVNFDCKLWCYFGTFARVEMIRFVEETRVRVYRSHVDDYVYMLVIGTHVPMIM